ncbi:hypothetical protein MRX96_011273 [Rhipicephalus microplus]
MSGRRNNGLRQAPSRGAPMRNGVRDRRGGLLRFEEKYRSSAEIAVGEEGKAGIRKLEQRPYTGGAPLPRRPSRERASSASARHAAKCAGAGPAETSFFLFLRSPLAAAAFRHQQKEDEGVEQLGERWRQTRRGAMTQGPRTERQYVVVT